MRREQNTGKEKDHPSDITERRKRLEYRGRKRDMKEKV